MSADLLAEFGQGSGSAPRSGQPQNTELQTDSLISGFDQSDDIFFGGSQHKTNSHLSDPRAPSTQYAPSAPKQPPAFQAFDLPRQHDSDILFDATEDTPASEEDDDWGEFEGPEASRERDQPTTSTAMTQEAKAPATRPQPQVPKAPKAHATVDLLDSLSLDDTSPATRQLPKPSLQKTPQARYPPPEPSWDDDSFGDWGDFTDGPSTKPVPSNLNPKKALQAIKSTPPQPGWDDTFEDWGDFTDGPSTVPAPPKPTPKLASQPSTTSPPSRSFMSSTPTSPPTVRPTNIPPPSVLLELLVDLFNNLQKEAATAKRQTQSGVTTATTIHNTLETASRIIAGRTLRWKRDTILSQSMRIGPAGKPGGMKLSAVNKHEDVKEEQDAVDVLSLWRERAALFNAVIQAAGLRPIPPIPSPSALKVITAKPEQGGIKASHACALCALKRDERVLKVDEDVQDSFGEWWTEHWGHTWCRMFWERNYGLLGQR
ncbi:uncharacterized protein N7498_003960 [Penicillium cinerascens]|uniref:Uncharacterized protein n=1 Tax=Penicillium cinerascens TaxID=70096 RepID=A0A9W9T7M6_9EURO|nr:uncharacterized protein N7498_003960 [Penicillium cinerascens]KAJ5212314.1 hypothetical protein N7498_003960 [Penicillium cinerascens]